MRYFRTKEDLYRILKKVFDRLQVEPERLYRFDYSNLVVRIRFVNPQGEILLDGRQPPLGLFFDQCPGNANFEMIVEADRLHRIWSGEETLHQSLFAGHITTKGNIVKAQPFFALMQSCQNVYSDCLSDYCPKEGFTAEGSIIG